ncbi:MAG: carboxypeptidase-like regulatory domain-containing protein [Gemmatimonadaceae bacterium]|nr:carboxypeptidase-like regulatory domain-containing protein [Gemmatimonadaceae bacterium]
MRLLPKHQHDRFHDHVSSSARRTLRHVLYVLYALAAAALLQTPVQAQQASSQPAVVQQAQPNGAIVGFVVDDSSKSPLAMVEVYIASAARFTRTDSSGRFVLGNLPKGTYDVRARRLGYEPLSKSLALNPADTVEYELAMVAAPQLIAQVDVRTPSDLDKPKLSDIERKKRGGMGRYFSRDDIEPFDDRQLSDLLMRFGGMRLIRGNHGDMVWVASSRAWGAPGKSSLHSVDRRNGADTRACYSAIYIDRGAVYQGRNGEVLFSINAVPPSVVESIEWYASPMELPPEYNTFGRSCGALVITTR